jgi:hypothetical protein
VVCFVFELMMVVEENAGKAANQELMCSARPELK